MVCVIGAGRFPKCNASRPPFQTPSPVKTRFANLQSFAALFYLYKSVQNNGEANEQAAFKRFLMTALSGKDIFAMQILLSTLR